MTRRARLVRPHLRLHRRACGVTAKCAYGFRAQEIVSLASCRLDPKGVDLHIESKKLVTSP